MSRKVYSFKNPHTIKSILLAQRSGLEIGVSEVQEAEQKGYKIYDCGQKAWFKFTVGTFVCKCGKLLSQGRWQ